MIPMWRRTAPKPAQIMEKLGYGPDNRLTIKVSTRNIPPYRDPAVILIDQLKEIYINGELDPVETVNGIPRSCARIIRSVLNLTVNGVDDPDQNSTRTYACGSERQLHRLLQSGAR